MWVSVWRWERVQRCYAWHCSNSVQMDSVHEEELDQSRKACCVHQHVCRVWVRVSLLRCAGECRMSLRVPWQRTRPSLQIRQYGKAPRYFLIENFLPSLRSLSLCLSINSFHSLSFGKHLLAYLQYIHTVYTLHTHNVAVATAAASCSLFCSFFSLSSVSVHSLFFPFFSDFLLYFISLGMCCTFLSLSLCLSFSFL